jgi:hypothetical protein
MRGRLIPVAEESAGSKPTKARSPSVVVLTQERARAMLAR